MRCWLSGGGEHKDLARLRAALARLSLGELEALAAAARAEFARSQDSPLGFAQFYRLLFDRPLPAHARQQWLPLIYQARALGKGAVIEAFRGSSKSTTLTVAWLAYRIGLEAHKSYLLLGANDEAARDSAGQVADIIAHNPGWRLVFPQVMPDRQAGWGHSGYMVRRSDLPYRQWQQMALQQRGKDPTLVGLGYRSRAVIGKHPGGVLLVDDIHDEHNTRSWRELQLVKKVLTGTILPTATPDTWQVFVGTPWRQDDALAYLKASGRYLSLKTPVYLEGRSPRQPAWPERFPLAEIDKIRQAVGEIEFARMYLLDLTAASGIHLRSEWLNTYRFKDLNPGWPVVMGVDYASVADRVKYGGRDYFAIAVGRALPQGGGVVLIDGVRKHVSQAEAQYELLHMAERYPTLQLVGVEAVGKGEEFFHLMLRTSRLPLQPVSPGRRSKGERYEKGMAPLFERQLALLSDRANDFITAFKQEWLQYPDGSTDDTLDAVYWMLYVALPHLLGGGGEKRPNPFVSLGRG